MASPELVPELVPSPELVPGIGGVPGIGNWGPRIGATIRTTPQLGKMGGHGSVACATRKILWRVLGI